jgi:hypothetical protein
MNRSFSTSLKSTALATTLIWVLNIRGNYFTFEIVPFVLLSIIPIWIVCYISILITIVPFSVYEEGKITNKQLFKKYFPYYSICVFFGCVAICINSNFEIFVIIFFATVFFTTIITWVWFFKEEEMNTQKHINNDTKL